MLLLAAAGDLHAREVLRGFGYWPSRQDADYHQRWFELTRDHADVFVVQKSNPFDEPARDVPGNWYTEFNSWLDRARALGRPTYVGLEPFDGKREGLQAPPGWKGEPSVLDPAWANAFEEVVVRNARRNRPTYLNPCIEVNMWYRHATAAQWQAFRALYERVYQQVKRVSPDTRVFCSLQYELLSGRLLPTIRPQWELLDDPRVALPRQDLLGISTYPRFFRPRYDPDDVDDDWYQDLVRPGLPPVFIAEMGWYSGERVGRFGPGSPQDQAKFVSRLPRLLRGVDLEAMLWVSLADLDPSTPGIPILYYTLGLLDHRMQPKPAWQAWQAFTRDDSPATVDTDDARRRGLVLLEGLTPVGTTRAFHRDHARDESGADIPVMVWDYPYSRPGVPAMLLGFQFPFDERHRGITLGLRSRGPATLAVILEEKGGGRYLQLVQVPAGRWHEAHLPWSGFAPQPDAPDANGRLDLAEIAHVAIMDFPTGASGENRILLGRLAPL